MRAIFLNLGLMIALPGLAAQNLGPPPPRPAAPPPKGAAECVRQAGRATLSNPEALRLCTGMDSVGPVDCFNKARATTSLTREESIGLCECATGAAPVDCYNEARKTTTLTSPEAIRLCNSSKYSHSPLVCLARQDRGFLPGLDSSLRY